MIGRAYRHELNGSSLSAGATQLEVHGVELRFGGVLALQDVSLTIKQQDVHAIIGPNGAGKTSLLNAISGLYRPQSGSIVYHLGPGSSRDLVRTHPQQAARLGVARTFQNIELFHSMTVAENLMLGRHTHMRHNALAGMLWVGPARRQEAAHREVVEEIIDLLRLQQARNRRVDELSYGTRKRVELGRALAMQPGLLLLDEPMAGMNSEEKEDMARFVLDIKEQKGISVVLIEHDMDVVMDISDHVTVLNFGKVIADGTAQQVTSDTAVIDAYLGGASTR